MVIKFTMCKWFRPTRPKMVLLANTNLCDYNQYPSYIVNQWYWPTVGNYKIVIGWDYKCDYIYYIHMVSADHGKECMLLAKYHICDDNQYLKYTTYIWYWQAIVNCGIVIGRYHKCDYIYYVYMVSADHGKECMLLVKYHICD